MNARTMRYVNYTAVLLIIMAAVYIPPRFFPVLLSFVVGPVSLYAFLCNTLALLCLLVAVWQIGLPAGLLLGCAAMTGFGFIYGNPFTMSSHEYMVMAANILANAVFCMTAWLPSLNRVVSAALASILRYVTLAALTCLAIPMLQTGQPGTGFLEGLCDISQLLQLAGALLAGLLAHIISQHLPRARR